MKANDPQADIFFEDEVRRIARNMWPQARYDGASIIDGQERDGVFITDECIHLLEATRSRQKAKAEQDIKKLCKLADSMKKGAKNKAVQCWFITESEPTADQRGVLAKIKGQNQVHALSFRQFENQLIDASSYLSLRNNFRFGSVQDPVTGDINPKGEYVNLDLIDSSTKDIWNIKQVTDQLVLGGRFLLLGDYGAGKSMTMREIFQQLRGLYYKNKIHCFPIYINMRDHFGQKDPTEILERHARHIGFLQPTHLVRAWRAGHAILLIDGFDEVRAQRLSFTGAKHQVIV